MSATGYVSVRTQYSGPAVANTAGTLVDVYDSNLVTTILTFDTAWSHTNASLGTGGETWTVSALTGPSGSLAMAHIVEVTIFNTGAHDITLGGAATHAFTGLWSANVTIPAGGTLVLSAPAGVAAVASTSDQIKVAAASSTTSYTIVIKGTVA